MTHIENVTRSPLSPSSKTPGREIALQVLLIALVWWAGWHTPSQTRSHASSK